MIGVELISDVDKKTPLEAKHVASMFEDIKDMGLLIGKGGIHGNVRLPYHFISISNQIYRLNFIKHSIYRYYE